MRFVDLFAGLGGFHLGLRRLGHKCVFACEVDPDLRRIYRSNFGIEPAGDITKVKADTIPPHDILCAGFPCQPFSKAGDQQGLNCPKWGNLFEKHVLRILRHHKPKYLFLENVPNLAHHDDGRTWKGLEAKLKRLGYKVDLKKISPHEFGIPQIRERVFIVGSRSDLRHFSWPEPNGRRKCSLTSVLDENPRAAKPITQQVIDCLDVWQDFVRRYPKDQQLPSFPIWSMEFGATYPYKHRTPRTMGTKALQKYRGSHGQKLAGLVTMHRLLSTKMDSNMDSKRCKVLILNAAC